MDNITKLVTAMTGLPHNDTKTASIVEFSDNYLRNNSLAFVLSEAKIRDRIDSELERMQIQSRDNEVNLITKYITRLNYLTARNRTNPERLVRVIDLILQLRGASSRSVYEIQVMDRKFEERYVRAENNKVFRKEEYELLARLYSQDQREAPEEEESSSMSVIESEHIPVVPETVQISPTTLPPRKLTVRGELQLSSKELGLLDKTIIFTKEQLSKLERKGKIRVGSYFIMARILNHLKSTSNQPFSLTELESLDHSLSSYGLESKVRATKSLLEYISIFKFPIVTDTTEGLKALLEQCIRFVDYSFDKLNLLLKLLSGQISIFEFNSIQFPFCESFIVAYWNRELEQFLGRFHDLTFNLASLLEWIEKLTQHMLKQTEGILVSLAEVEELAVSRDEIEVGILNVVYSHIENRFAPCKQSMFVLFLDWTRVTTTPLIEKTFYAMSTGVVNDQIKYLINQAKWNNSTASLIPLFFKQNSKEIEECINNSRIYFKTSNTPAKNTLNASVFKLKIRELVSRVVILPEKPPKKQSKSNKIAELQRRIEGNIQDSQYKYTFTGEISTFSSDIENKFDSDNIFFVEDFPITVGEYMNIDYNLVLEYLYNKDIKLFSRQVSNKLMDLFRKELKFTDSILFSWSFFLLKAGFSMDYTVREVFLKAKNKKFNSTHFNIILSEISENSDFKRFSRFFKDLSVEVNSNFSKTVKNSTFPHFSSFKLKFELKSCLSVFFDEEIKEIYYFLFNLLFNFKMGTVNFQEIEGYFSAKEVSSAAFRLLRARIFEFLGRIQFYFYEIVLNKNLKEMNLRLRGAESVSAAVEIHRETMQKVKNQMGSEKFVKRLKKMLVIGGNTNLVAQLKKVNQLEEERFEAQIKVLLDNFEKKRIKMEFELEEMIENAV